MKTLILVLSIIPLFCYSQAQNTNELLSANLKKYEIRSGEIKYAISGDATGKETMTFDSYGWKSVRKQEMTFELYGIESTQSVYEIKDGDMVYRLNENDSSYSKKIDLKWSQQASYKEPDEVSEAILFSMGGTQQSDSTLNGRVCQVWTFERKAVQEMWIWKGLVLKRKAKLGNRNIISVATEISLEIEPNTELFQIPAYYEEKK